MSDISIQSSLKGGHPNSLGNTEAVTQRVLKDESLLPELLECYKSDDEVVRLRVSSCLKRVCKSQPDWVYKYMEPLLTDVSRVDQASAKWTLAIIFGLLRERMTDSEYRQAIEIMKQNLFYPDWIVQNTMLQHLWDFSRFDEELSIWLEPQIHVLSESPWKSVNGRAKKLIDQLESLKSMKNPSS